MDCPKCGGKSFVLRTRKLSNGQVRRFRYCEECDTYFQTLERVAKGDELVRSKK